MLFLPSPLRPQAGREASTLTLWAWGAGEGQAAAVPGTWVWVERARRQGATSPQTLEQWASVWAGVG